MTNAKLNREYLIRYYPDSRTHKGRRLIGAKTFRKILDRKSTIETTLKNLAKSTKDKHTVKFDRGCMFVFASR